MTERSGNSMHESTLLDNITYFKSPLLTLTASLDDDSDTTVHDILDAYNTFNARIRAVAPLLSTPINTPSALRLVSSCSDSLARCLQRDIRKALEDPLSSRSQCSAAPMRGGAALLAMGQCGEDVHRFYEVSMVCQYAIQTTVTILRFPNLCSLFAESVVLHLINDIMLVARSSELPGPDSEKTGALAASLFFTLRVPESTFASSKVHMLEWMDDLVRSMSPKNEGSKIVHHLLSEYPAAFLPNAVHLLPQILLNLTTADVSRRTDATQALSGYVLGFISSWPMPTTSVKDEALAVVQQFLRSQLPSSSSNADRKKTTTLPHHLARAITEEAKTSDDRGSRWAITVICCLIVLAGHGVFTGTRSLRFVLDTAQQVYKAKKRTSEDLLACVWRCLVWAFAQIPPEHGQIDTSDQPANARPRSSRKALFGIVRQECRFGVGAYLVANLLFARQDGYCLGEDTGISWAILVMKDMLSHSHESVYRDGMTILARLVSAIGSSALPPPSSGVVPWTLNQTVVRALFTRHILTADSKTFFSHIHAANRLDPTIVRPLSEHEITQHWAELHDLWAICVRRELQRAQFTTLPDCLLATWQALLLVETHLTQELGHLTATQGCTERIVSAVAACLDCSEPSTEAPSVPATTSQSRALSVCHKLWAVIRHVFADTWLLEAASALLTRVVQHSFDMSCEEVKAAWSRLCAALMSASSPDFIDRLASTADERVQIMEVRRRLWRLSAETWTSREPQPDWEDSVEHLVVYVRDLSTAEPDFELWDAVLQYAVKQAEIATGSCMAVYDSLIDRACQSMENFKLQSAPQLAVHLLSRLQVHGELCLSSTFLREINIFLYNIHTNASEDITTALQSLHHVRRLIHECPTHSVFALLLSLDDGLTVWVADREEFLSDDEYNHVIVPLYQSALNALRAIPFSFDTLDALAHFLYSAWIRIPAPASAPKAFHEFWCDIQSSLSFSSYDYPDEIKYALRACHDFFGYGLPEGISLDTESQMETQAHGLLMPSSSPGIPASPTGCSTSGLGVSERDSSPSPSRHNHSHLHADQSPASAPRNFRSPHPTTPRRGASRNSTHAPISPADAVRARRFAASSSTSRVSHEKASRTPERPLKRRKVASSTPAKDSPTPASPILSPAATREAFTSQIVSEAQVLPFQKRPRTPSTPKTRASPQEEVKAEELLSPEVPSPTTAARIAPPSSDDYDSWEVPIFAEPEPEGEDGNEDMDTRVVPDSQPSGAEDAEDSLVPSFMKTTKDKGKGKARADEGQNEDSDVLIPDNFSFSPSTSSSSFGKRTRPTSPLRMHTAPASFARCGFPDAIPAVPLRRAQTGTGSAHLDGLRDAHAAVEMEGSQLELDELLAVEEQASRLQAIVREKLVKRFKKQERK